MAAVVRLACTKIQGNCGELVLGHGDWSEKERKIGAYAHITHLDSAVHPTTALYSISHFFLDAQIKMRGNDGSRSMSWALYADAPLALG
jgi:hypothetical protein